MSETCGIQGYYGEQFAIVSLPVLYDSNNQCALG